MKFDVNRFDIAKNITTFPDVFHANNWLFISIYGYFAIVEVLAILENLMKFRFVPNRYYCVTTCCFSIYYEARALQKEQ